MVLECDKRVSFGIEGHLKLCDTERVAVKGYLYIVKIYGCDWFHKELNDQ